MESGTYLQVGHTFYYADRYSEAYMLYRRGARHCIPISWNIDPRQECEEKLTIIAEQSQHECSSLVVLFQALGTDRIQSNDNWNQRIHNHPLFDFQLLPLILCYARRHPSVKELNYCGAEEESVWDGPHGDFVMHMFS